MALCEKHPLGGMVRGGCHQADDQRLCVRVSLDGVEDWRVITRETPHLEIAACKV